MSDCFKASNTMIKRLSVCTFALLMLVLLLNGVTSVKTAAQASTWPPLPAPIIFYDFQGRLIYVDHRTQTTKFFYTDADFPFMRPLSWSPQGDLFLFFRETRRSDRAYMSELCLLNRQGVLQRCLADNAVDYGNHFYDQLGQTIWSADGKYVYFLAYSGNFQRMRFVEAEVATGATNRVLYEVPENSKTNFLATSKDLDYLMTNTGELGGEGTPELIDLATKKATPFNTLNSIESKRFLCLGFSPNSQYLTVRNLADDNKPVMEIINLQGQVVRTITGFDGGGLFEMSCPIWQVDSNTLYFQALNVDFNSDESRFFRVLRYSLSQQKLSVVYEPAGGEYTPPDPSSVDEILEGTETFVYLLRPGITDVYNAPLGFLINGEVYQLNLPYAAATFPIWSIDLSVPLVTATPTAVPTPAPTSTPTPSPTLAWPPLPAPIIFSDTEGHLIYIDHHTQTTRILYTNPDPITIRALGWSPQGDLLLFFREDLNAAGQIIPQLCLLNRQGVLQRCFADSALNYGNDYYDQLGATTWSADGRYLYFLIYSENDQRRRFVEAEVATGATKRVLYEVPKNSSMGFLAISKDLRYLIANIGNTMTIGTPYLVDLAMQNEINLDTAYAVESRRFLCFGFSPNGQYLVMRNFANAAKPVMEIINLQGQVLHTIAGPDGGGLFNMSCPTWQSDSNTLYFQALNASYNVETSFFRILRYELTQQQTTILYEPIGGIYTFPGPESIESLLKGTEAFVYKARRSFGDTSDSVIGVLLNGQLHRLDLTHEQVYYPIWSIDLSVPLVTATPTPAPN
jgi:Tol biopolymer transport system component